MDDESWQTNLESWRERRRAAARALNLEIPQYFPSSPPPPQGIVESVIRSPTLSNSGIDILENPEKLKTPENSTSDGADRLTQRTVANSVSSGIVKNNPFLLSDAERVKQLTNRTAGKRSPPLRIRLVCDPDCVKADNLGLIIAALGNNEGPPFIIRDLIKGSMAERGNLQIGDELFSVDNLCCTFASDRPIIISTLTKLHQLFQRLSIKQRPVEVKVLRGNENDSDRGTNSLAHRLLTNGEPNPTHSSNSLSHSRFNEGKTAENGVSGSGGIALIELEKAHPIKATERILPSLEHVESKYSDSNHSLFISSSPLAMASTVSTVRSNYETTDRLIQPISTAFAETVNIRHNDHDDADEYDSNSQRKLERPASKLYSNHSEKHSYSQTFEDSMLPPPPTLTSSDSLAATPSETPPSIDAIQPPDMESSILEDHSANSLICSLPPPPPPSPPISLIPNISSSHPHHHSNANQKQYVKDTVNIAQDSEHASFPTKTSSSDDILKSDVITNNRGHVQYDSDVISDDTRVYANSSTSARCGWRSELNISYPGAERRPNVSSDIDSDIDLQNPSVWQVEREPKVEAGQSTEGIELKVLSGKEKILASSESKPHYFSRPVTSIAKPETQTVESWTLSPLQSVEPRNDLSQSEEAGKFGHASVDATGRRIEEEPERRPRKKARSISKRVPSDPLLRKQNSPSTRPPRVNVIGTWYTCAGCNQQLGSSDLMIIEQLNLFYHLSCFVCARCGIQLSDGQNETSVRIRNGLIYCYICYHRLNKPLTGKDKSKPKSTPENNEQHSSLSRTTATIGPLTNTSGSYQTNSSDERELVRLSLSHF